MCDVIGTFLHYSYEPVSKVRASEMVHLEGSGKVGTLDADNYTRFFYKKPVYKKPGLESPKS